MVQEYLTHIDSHFWDGMFLFVSTVSLQCKHRKYFLLHSSGEQLHWRHQMYCWAALSLSSPVNVFFNFCNHLFVFFFFFENYLFTTLFVVYFLPFPNIKPLFTSYVTKRLIIVQRKTLLMLEKTLQKRSKNVFLGIGCRGNDHLQTYNLT